MGKTYKDQRKFDKKQLHNEEFTPRRRMRPEKIKDLEDWSYEEDYLEDYDENLNDPRPTKENNKFNK